MNSSFNLAKAETLECPCKKYTGKEFLSGIVLLAGQAPVSGHLSPTPLSGCLQEPFSKAGLKVNESKNFSCWYRSQQTITETRIPFNSFNKIAILKIKVQTKDL